MFCACVVNSSSLTVSYNAALNKTSYQSSVYKELITNISFPAYLANDGNRQTLYKTDYTPHCAISYRDINPWWAVDLERPTTVYRVDLTSTYPFGGTYVTVVRELA